ncbi:SemiSWEET family transporter [Francisellaceae bacterium]|nr:SemiSWEET family transporter [Francisellaceae bacterium]
MHMISNFCGVVANITSNIAFIPQIIKSYRRKSVADISIGMFTILFVTQICWIIYSIPIKANQLIISSLVEIFLLLPIFAMWWFYSKNTKKSVSISDAPIELASDI